MFGKLYIVATPIGNLKDITLRAISILSEVDIILAEDTRVTKKLLDFLYTKYNIPYTKLLSYHQHSSEEKKLEILNFLIQGKDIALVTDAGTPGISDPANELIEFILKNDPQINIVPIPGASAITAALSISGFNVNGFIFLGFWPKKKYKRVIEKLKLFKMPFVFYESPYRIKNTLELIKNEFGDEVRICVARELTKIHETIYRGTFKEVINSLEGQMIKGEIVVIVEYNKINF